ncbi:MAG TPA: alpha/beta hydrolase, partial [Gaiellaceae bacterium]|nr:alpha/beta hydrolase [Gaiellaceae bacterium]
LSGTGLVSLHLIDVALVDVEPGASLARHLPWMAVTLAVAAAAALTYRRLPRAIRGAVAGTFGALAAFDALQHATAASDDLSVTGLLTLPAAALLLGAAAGELWGLNRGRRRAPAWARRGAGVLGAAAIVGLVVGPVAFAIYNVHKPRRALQHADLGVPYHDVYFRSTDGIRIHAWWVPGRKETAVVVVHGAGGDAYGARRQERILADNGYGVLAIDARGRGLSEGDNENLGWHWDRDVRGGVDWLTARGVTRIGALGLSTGADSVIHAAAEDDRIGAVVADGSSLRSSADAADWHGPQKVLGRIIIGAGFPTYQLLSWSSTPPTLSSLVPKIAPRPLLLIATAKVKSERDINRTRYRAAGEPKALWVVADTGHTEAAQRHPREYARRIVATFDHTRAVR